MRNNTLLLVFFILLGLPSCKTLQKKDKQEVKAKVITQPGKTIGTITHNYKGKECPLVIFIQKEGQILPMMLIPVEPIPAEFDKDGTQIRFDYRALKIQQPSGCPKGIPAELSNISIYYPPD